MYEWGASVHATSHSRVLSVCSGVIPCTVCHWSYRLGGRACELHPQTQWGHGWSSTGGVPSRSTPPWPLTYLTTRLSTTVHRKATHTDRYIHFTSNHHNKVKRGVIKCLKWRATKICNTKDLEAEKDYLRMTFRKNRYLEKLITSTMMMRSRQ